MQQIGFAAILSTNLKTDILFGGQTRQFELVVIRETDTESLIITELKLDQFGRLHS